MALAGALACGLVGHGTALAEEGARDAGLAARVRAVIEHDKLVSRPACVAYLVTRNSDPGVDRVDIVETHDVACGGDARVMHRLFSVYIDQKTRAMASDAADPVDGTLKPLGR